MMMTIGFLLGFALTAPVMFAVGVISAGDRRRTHELADIRPALRRSVR